MPIKKSYLAISVALVLLLCLTQIIGSTLLIVPCLAAFLVFVGWSCSNNYTLPVLLFFLPWSPILRTSPDGYSFFTFALVLVCAISVIKKRFRFKKYPIVAGIVLLFLTLVSKVIDGYMISFDYIAFMMLIVLFPVVKAEWTVKNYDFYQVVLFFSLGVIIAALCALSLDVFPNIAKYIRVDSYSTITRRSGFYGDANFYTAQITASLSGCLLMVLKEQKRGHIVTLISLLILLIYCGFLSASKSFVLVTAGMTVLWGIALLRLKGRVALKVLLLVVVAVFAVFIATSALFGELIEVVATRFSYANDLDSFTTGRTGLWQSYIADILKNVKTFFIGKGLTNVKVNDRGSHNTLIQIIYQFGFVGIPFLLYWSIGFFRGGAYKGRRIRKNKIDTLLLAVGIFMPWMAIDALFFDEFFLLQWYMFDAMRYLEQEQIPQSVPREDRYG